MTEYVKAENYVRAQESCREALILAEELHDKDDETDLKANLILFDNIIQANEFLKTGDYYAAYDTYVTVLKNSGGLDKTTVNYIQRRINRMETYIDVAEFLKLGDSFFRQGNYDEAEGMYLKAIEKSDAIHDNASREKAFAAIEKIYDKRAALRKEAADKVEEKKQVALSDALKKGDDLLAAGDLDGARKAYLDARNLSDDPAVRMQTAEALGKVTDAQNKKAEDERLTDEAKKKNYQDAEQIEKNGDDAFDKEDYLSAQMFYMRAIEKYISLGEVDKSKLIQTKYDIATEKYSALDNQKKEAEAMEQKARDYYANRNYAEAKSTVAMTKTLYSNLGLKTKVDEMDILLQQIATDEIINDSVK